MKANYNHIEIIEKIRQELLIGLTDDNISHLHKCMLYVINELLCDYPFMIAVEAYGLEISNDALFYGTCAEHCLMSGDIDKAKHYNEEYLKIVAPNKKTKIKKFIHN